MGKFQEVASFLVILVILPSVILKMYPGNIEMPPTLYEVIVEKCPNLEKIDMQENLTEILDKKCVNWPVIEKVTAISDDKTKIQCLLLYESLLPFCTQFGEKIVQFGAFLKASLNEVYNLTTVCGGDKNLVTALKNTTYNLTNILQLSTCPLICYAPLSGDKLQTTPMCSMAYFLSSFDLTKFLSTQASLVSQQNHTNNLIPGPVPNKVINKESEKKNEEVQQQIANNNKDSVGQKHSSPSNIHASQSIKNNELKIEASKAKHPLTNQIDNEKPKEISKLEEPSVPEVAVAQAQETETQNQPPKTKETESPNKNEKSEANAEKAPLKDESSEVNPDIADPRQDINGYGKDVDDMDQKDAGGAEGGTNEAKDDFAEEHNKDYADDSGGDKDPLGVPKYGLPDEPVSEKKPTAVKQKPSTVDGDQRSQTFPESEDDMDGDSYFFSYFSVLMCLVIVGYVAYHNRQKVLAFLLEGKRGRRGSRMGRRPNSANYHKLDSNLEEAISSSCAKNASNVIY